VAVRAHAVREKPALTRREVLAVLKLAVLTQIEPPAGRLDDFPALSQPWNNLQGLAALGQTLVDVAQHSKGEALVERVRVEGLQIALEGKFERRGGRRQDQRGEQARRKKYGFDFHRSPRRRLLPDTKG